MSGSRGFQAVADSFLHDTRCLTFEEKACARLVLDLLLINDGGVPDDVRYIAGQLGCDVRVWKRLRGRLLALGLYDVNGGCIELGAAFERTIKAFAALGRPGYEWQKVRAAVMAMGEPACGYCGSVEGPFEVDHVHPRSRGGSDEPGNLVVACRTCNRSKGAKLLEEWLGGTV